MKPVNFRPLTALLLLTATAAVLLQGCASAMNPVGESKFDCNRKQDAKSPYCRSFKAVEAATAADLPKSRFDQEFTLSEIDRMTGIAPDDKKTVALPVALQVNATTILPHQAGYGQPLAGVPVREGPVIQRVWVKRFVDDRDLLTENTIVYKEIRNTRWAGFDASSQSGNGLPGAYPHKPVVVVVVAPQQTKDTEKSQDTTDFKQPGDNFSGQDETAPTPAGSGVLTMPQ